MGRTPFLGTLNEPDHHFSNIEQTRKYSFMDDRTRTPNFWLRQNGHQTSNLIGPSLDLLNYLSNRVENRFLEHRTNLNVLIFW